MPADTNSRLQHGATTSNRFAAGSLTILLAALAACGSSRHSLPEGDNLPRVPGSPVVTRQAFPAQPGVAIAAPGNLSTLPAPSGLPKSSSAADVRALAGFDYDASLPFARVIDTDPENFAPAGSTLDKSAYAVYHFDLPTYSGPGQLQTYWSGTAPADSDLYFGVADFGTNRWRWYQGSSSAAISFEDDVVFKSPGNQAYVVVLLSGDAIGQLSYLVFGEDLPPTPVIVTNDNFADAPASVQFDAYFSTDDVGITLVEWDLDNDGAFEVQQLISDYAYKTYNNPGSYPVTLRVTDSAGQQVTTSATIIADAPGYDEVEPNTLTPNPLPALPIRGWDGNLGPGGYDGGNVDIYSIHMDLPCISILSAQTTAGGDPLTITVTDSAGLTDPATSGSGSRVGLPYRFTPGDYLLQVSSPGTVSTDYALICTADYYSKRHELEDNDDRSLADRIQDVPIGNLGLGGYDGDREDFTYLDVAGAGDAWSFDCFINSSGPNVDIELQDSNGTVLANGAAAGPDKIIYTFPTAGKYYLRTFMPASTPIDANADYVLAPLNLGKGPTPSLVITPDNGAQPLTVTLDASGSTASPGDAITGFDWDLNNDGIVDYQTAANDPSFAVVVYRAGGTTVRLGVRQDTGAIAYTTATVAVTGDLDEAEPNDDAPGAQLLPSLSESPFFGNIGPGTDLGGSDDYYQLVTDSAGTLAVEVDTEVVMNVVGLALYDSGGNLVSSDLSADGIANVNTSVGAGELYYIFITTNPNTTQDSGYAMYVGL